MKAGVILVNKYEELLEDFMEFIEEIDSEVLIYDYDLTKLEESLTKTIDEA